LDFLEHLERDTSGQGGDSQSNVLGTSTYNEGYGTPEAKQAEQIPFVRIQQLTTNPSTFLG
jgi:hypothetical protein